MKQVDLNNRQTFYASDDLITEVKAKIKDTDLVLNFAYTDYGGTIFDKLIIEYFEQNFPENIISETAIYYGKNAFIYGDLAVELKEASEDYLLGFREFEDFFYIREDEIKREGVKFALENLKDKYQFPENIEDIIVFNYEDGQVLTNGWDFSETDLIKYCKENNLLTEIEE